MSARVSMYGYGPAKPKPTCRPDMEVTYEYEFEIEEEYKPIIQNQQVLPVLQHGEEYVYVKEETHHVAAHEDVVATTQETLQRELARLRKLRHNSEERSNGTPQLVDVRNINYSQLTCGERFKNGTAVEDLVRQLEVVRLCTHWCHPQNPGLEVANEPWIGN